MISRLFAILLVSALAFGEAKPKPTDYPVHQQVGEFTIAAENLGHSISTPEGVLFARDYLVIEVAIYPNQPKVFRTHFTNREFSLRLDGKKTILLPQAPGMVAASIKYEDWERRPTLVGTVGTGMEQIIINRPRSAPRFPGDRTETNRYPSPPVSAPPPPHDVAVTKDAPASIEEIVDQYALHDGVNPVPSSAFLYFLFKGKLSKLKSVELLYEGPWGSASIRLP
jgi:hypothetical protein